MTRKLKVFFGENDSNVMSGFGLGTETSQHTKGNYMTTFIFSVGLILVICSVSCMYTENTEWHAPLLELSLELRGCKELLPGIRRRGVLIAIFYLILFVIGGDIVIKSPIIQDYKEVAIFILGVILSLVLTALYKLTMASYSKKTRLLNYLYSPYLFAWRRDRMISYSDQEVAIAICRACDIHDDSLINEDADLKDFLIALHRKTRPSKKYDETKYSKFIDENIEQAMRLIPSNPRFIRNSALASYFDNLEKM